MSDVMLLHARKHQGKPPRTPSASRVQPTLVDEEVATTASVQNAASATTVALAVDDQLVVKRARSSGPESGAWAANPSGGGLTWTRRAVLLVTNKCEIDIWTSSRVTAAGAVTVSSGTTSVSNPKSMTVEAWRGAPTFDGTQRIVQLNGAALGIPDAAHLLSTLLDQAEVTWVAGDWSAITPAGTLYHSGAVAQQVHNVATQYTAYHARQDALLAGPQRIGLRAGAAGQAWDIVALEIPGAVSGSSNPRGVAEGLTTGDTSSARVILARTAAETPRHGRHDRPRGLQVQERRRGPHDGRHELEDHLEAQELRGDPHDGRRDRRRRHGADLQVDDRDPHDSRHELEGRAGEDQVDDRGPRHRRHQLEVDLASSRRRRGPGHRRHDGPLELAAAVRRRDPHDRGRGRRLDDRHDLQVDDRDPHHGRHHLEDQLQVARRRRGPHHGRLELEELDQGPGGRRGPGHRRHELEGRAGEDQVDDRGPRDRGHLERVDDREPLPLDLRVPDDLRLELEEDHAAAGDRRGPGHLRRGRAPYDGPTAPLRGPHPRRRHPARPGGREGDPGDPPARRRRRRVPGPSPGRRRRHRAARRPPAARRGRDLLPPRRRPRLEAAGHDHHQPPAYRHDRRQTTRGAMMTFRLHRHGREHYDQKIATVPPILAWEISLDDGATWTAGTALAPADPDWYRWLVAGDLAPTDLPVAGHLTPTGDRDLVPIARAIANPEIIVRNLEPIRVE